MNTEKLIGSLSIRVATAALGLLSGLGLLISRGRSGDGHNWLRTLAIVCAVLAVLAGIHCSRKGYARWMRFAKLLSGVSTTLLFGLCYLLLVPLFLPMVWALDPLRLWRGTTSDSYWHNRPDTPVDPDMLRRMG